MSHRRGGGAAVPGGRAERRDLIREESLESVPTHVHPSPTPPPEHIKDAVLQLEQTMETTANWLRLCRTPGSEHRHLMANMGRHLSPPPGRHGEQGKHAQRAKDVSAGTIGETGAGGKVGRERGAHGRGRGFHSNRGAAKLGS